MRLSKPTIIILIENSECQTDTHNIAMSTCILHACTTKEKPNFNVFPHFHFIDCVQSFIYTMCLCYLFYCIVDVVAFLPGHFSPGFCICVFLTNHTWYMKIYEYLHIFLRWENIVSSSRLLARKLKVTFVWMRHFNLNSSGKFLFLLLLLECDIISIRCVFLLISQENDISIFDRPQTLAIPIILPKYLTPHTFISKCR